ncbi:MAG: hypothetical protein JEZ08_25260 [Clostridiales bacterium]|nr:hypothetical protein [Clostridiales bacterium]
MKTRKWIKLNIITSLLLTVSDHLYATFQMWKQLESQIGKQMGYDYFLDRLFGIGESASIYGMSIRFFGKSYSTQMNLYQFLLFRFVSIFIILGAIILIVTFSKMVVDIIKNKYV